MRGGNLCRPTVCALGAPLLDFAVKHFVRAPYCIAGLCVGDGAGAAMRVCGEQLKEPDESQDALLRILKDPPIGFVFPENISYNFKGASRRRARAAALVLGAAGWCCSLLPAPCAGEWDLIVNEDEVQKSLVPPSYANVRYCEAGASSARSVRALSSLIMAGVPLTPQHARDVQLAASGHGGGNPRLPTRKWRACGAARRAAH